MPNWKKVIVSGSNAALNSLYVSTSFTASGLIYPTSDNGEESFVQTDGLGNLTLQYVKTIYEEIYNGELTTIVKGTPLYVSGAVGDSAVVFRADASNPTKMPVIYIAADTINAGATGRGIALGLIKGVDTTGYPAGTEVYVGIGGGWTSTRPTGSAIVQTLGYVTKEGAGGQGVVLNPGPNSLPNLPSGSIWVGNNTSIPTALPTSSLSVSSASYAFNADKLDGKDGSEYAITGSNIFRGDQIITGSVDVSGNLAVGTTGSGIFGRLDVSGDVVAGQTSDKRLKTNLVPIQNPLKKVNKISGYTFDWVDDDELFKIHGFKGQDIGLIAQEIEKVIPEIVILRDNGYKAVRYDKMVAVLIEAIKEQQKQIDKLEKKLNIYIKKHG